MTRVSRAEIDASEEGREEVFFVDRLLEGWAWYARNTGLPRLTTKCSLGSLQKADDQGEASAARARVLELTDGQFLLIDQTVASLPKALRRIVWGEYWHPAPLKVKARRASLTVLEYRQRLNAARWAVYVSLQPSTDWWRRAFPELR